MSILSKIGEMFGLEEPGLYSSRLFDSLQNLEISARVCERGRPEEKITSFRGGSLGIIEIAEAQSAGWVPRRVLLLGGNVCTGVHRVYRSGCQSRFNLPEGEGPQSAR